MDRREQRVGLGVGAFHNPPRVQYSDETRNLIKMLMEESKLSMMQRKSIQNVVDRGEPLPPPSRATSATVHSLRKAPHPLYWKKRSQEAILNSGAYEREQYRRITPLLNQEKQKRHLACMMAYGKNMPETPHGSKIQEHVMKTPITREDVDPLQDLVLGIRERIEFLKDMENLGLGKKYRPIIHQEIAEKIRIIEAIDSRKSGEIERQFGGLKYERPPPKLLPMGELDDES